jgi:hypothetical protein
MIIPYDCLHCWGWNFVKFAEVYDWFCHIVDGSLPLKKFRNPFKL